MASVLKDQMNKTEDIYEKMYWASGRYIMGIDEAGRGPICGPVVVAGCVLPIGYQNSDIYDSKKISPKKREQLFTTIINEAIYYKIEVVSNKMIDEFNIYNATKMAMEKLALSKEVDVVLTDAMALDIDREVIALIKGDQKSINIAAASIIAKVVRDHIMKGYDYLYPDYGFSKHQGYYTKAHKEALMRYGSKDFYRFSFAPSREYKKD